MSVTTKIREQVGAMYQLLWKSDRATRQTFVRSWVRFPLSFRAEQTASRVPSLTVNEMLQDFGIEQMVLDARGTGSDLHDWGLRPFEQEILVTLITSSGFTNIFEIGTFDGGTTRLLACAGGADSTVHTIDLPPAEFDETQSPEAFDSSMVGWKFANTPEAGRIVQLLGDSTTFDFSPWFGQIDLVFVDGGHDHRHGRADSRNALRMVRPGGLIVWDDFVPFWWGLVEGVVEMCDGRDLKRISGTNFAYLRM
jgi:predicted O-methyltransferase YrrM